MNIRECIGKFNSLVKLCKKIQLYLGRNTALYSVCMNEQYFGKLTLRKHAHAINRDFFEL